MLTKHDYYVAGEVKKSQNIRTGSGVFLSLWYGFFLMFVILWGATR